MDFVSAQQAADRLGLSSRQVRTLAAAGQLKTVARGLIDERSVRLYETTRNGARRRAWSEATAWGAVAILTGISPVWLGPTQRSRLKAALRSMNAPQLRARARNRASVHHLHAHPSAHTRLRDNIVEPGGMAATLGLSATRDRTDGYTDPEGLARIIHDFALTDDLDGNVTLRCTTFDLDVLSRICAAGSVLAALDLSESFDNREQAAGLEGVTNALRHLRE